MLKPLTVLEAAEARRSIRKYDPSPVPDQDLREILRLAGLAPSAWNLQPWRVTVVRDPALKARVAPVAYHQPQVTGAPVLLVIASDMKDTLGHLDEVTSPGVQGEKREAFKKSVLGALGGLPEAEREAWGNAQANIFLGFLLLAAKSLGYDSSPMLGFQPEAVKAVLGLPSHVRVPALVALGKGVEEGTPHFRLDLEKFVTWR